jgi:Ca-activated chloride channel homolog
MKPHPHFASRRVIATLLGALQLLPLASAYAADLEPKYPVAGVNRQHLAIHFIANADPRCPRYAQPELAPAAGAASLQRMPVPAPALAAPVAPPPAMALHAPAPAPATTAHRAREGVVADAKALGQNHATAKPFAAPLAQPEADAARAQVKTQKYDANPIKRVAQEPISTFSVDVDTGSYASVRGLLRKGQSLPAGSVRVEEMINYFDYAYPRPEQTQSAAPFAVSTEIAPAPWNASNHLLRVGLQARDAAKDSLPAANLVFLIDVSGSMHIPQSLPLVQDAMLGLVQQLRAQDKVTIVTYAGSTRVVLPPISGARKELLADTICGLNAAGSTAGASGIRLAYEQAKAAFIPGGINRILLATDGDFNVGVSDTQQLKDMVAQERQHGISLSTLGVGGVS